MRATHKKPAQLFGKTAESKQVRFHLKEWRWLRREAKRRRITPDELLDLLCRRYVETGEHVTPHYPLGEPDDISPVINDIIRTARMAQ